MRIGIRAGLVLALTFGLTAGCDNDGGTDGGTIPADSGTRDAGRQDAGTPDSGPDAGTIDGGTIDAGTDAGADAGADGGGTDGGATDAGIDAGMSDAGTDGGETDAGGTDAGTDGGGTDAGTDAGMADGGPVTGMTPVAGDLVIVEVQGNPTNVSDNQAEYFEVLNVSGRTLDLDGVWLAFHTWVGGEPDVSVSKTQISGTVLVSPGGRVLFGRSSGGFFGSGTTPDVTYSAFEFNNGQPNRLRLLVPTWGGTEPPAAADLIDGVVFEAGAFDNDLRGQAFQFNPSVGAATPANNDDNSNWCHTSMSLAPYLMSGTRDNHGTPGAPNDCG
ncbi:MAG: hypothetical protein AB8I08_12485 [Sandaracinaceae bacterium]